MFSSNSVDVTSADSGSREYLIHPNEPLSRSNEELAIIETMPPKEKKKIKKKKFNSLSKIFGKKHRPTLEQIVFDGKDIDWSTLCFLSLHYIILSFVRHFVVVVRSLNPSS